MLNKLPKKISNKIVNSNEITIIYKIPKDKNRIKLFGKIFIKNNKNNCKIIINSKVQEIIEFIDINEKMKKKIN